MSGELQSLELRGAKTSYREWGGQNSQTLLCLHGNPTSSYLWRHLGEGLGDSLHVLAPDLPGQGDSEIGGRAGTWEELEQFVEDFAGAVGLKEFDLVLHDWGGLIGFRWLFDHSHRLENLQRLVISDTGFFVLDNSAWHSLAKIWRTPDEGEAWMDALTFEQFRGGMLASAPALTEEAVAEYWKSFATPERRAAKLVLYRSGDFEKIKPYDGKLRTLICPTLILWGENDPYIPPAAAHQFHDQIPNAHLHILPGTGHFLWEEAPDKTVQLVREFLLAK